MIATGATVDKFVLWISATDPKWNAAEAERFVKSLGADGVRLVDVKGGATCVSVTHGLAVVALLTLLAGCDLGPARRPDAAPSRATASTWATSRSSSRSGRTSSARGRRASWSRSRAPSPSASTRTPTRRTRPTRPVPNW